MTDKSKIKESKELWTECESEWTSWMTTAEEDMKFYLGDQWDGADRSKLEAEKRPVLSLNKIKKQIDLVSGYERQNSTDLRVQPVEASDQPMADVYSEVLKWTISDRGGSHYISNAFENALKVGVGYIWPEIEYDKDFVNGDLRLRSENPFRIMLDPDFSEPDLSDCGYFFRFSWMGKSACKALYPDFAEDIEKLSGGNKSEFTFQTPLTNTKNRVMVKERWYREYVKKKFVVDGLMVVPVEGSRVRNIEDLKKNMPDQYGHLEIIERTVPVIKLFTTVGNEVIVYDDDSPYKCSMYPLIPIFAYYTASYNDLEWKLAGMVRVLKDVQRETNKRRSQLLHAAMTVPLSGWMYEEGAVDSPEELKNSAGAGKSLKVRDMNKLKQIMPTPLPGGLIQLEKMHQEDMLTMGLNADTLGTIDGGSGASAPGITLQLRQRQSLISVQGLFSNLSYSKKLLGKYLIELINLNWNTEKIERIINRPVPEGFDEVKAMAQYDCVIDEVMNSPTYRMNNFQIIMTMMGQGFPVSPETSVKWSDFPQGLKDDLNKDIQAAKAPPPVPAPAGPGGMDVAAMMGGVPPVSEAPMEMPPQQIPQPTPGGPM